MNRREGPMRIGLLLAISFCGPTILVLLVTTWVFGLMLGGAAVIYPRMG